MNTTKKLLILCLAALMAIAAMMPSTFSWYSNNEIKEDDEFYYTKEGLPVSYSSSLTMNTVEVNKDEKVLNNGATVASVSGGAKIRYYKTTFTNSDTHDAYAELDVGNLDSNAGVKLGVYEPVLNEKGFEISKTPTVWGKKRIYFQPTLKYKFWYGAQHGNENLTTWDGQPSKNMLQYSIGSETLVQVEMTKCTSVPSTYKDACSSYSNEQAVVFYADIPGNATSMFFYNSRYYDPNNSNYKINRTEDITDIATNTIYKLNGLDYQDSYKKYVTETVDSLAMLTNYYDNVKLGNGDHMDIGLKNPEQSVSEDGTVEPDYHGNSISYSSSNKAVVSVDSNGILTAVSGGTATITTTITSLFGDTIPVTTTVNVTDKVEQMPVVQNLKVAAGETANVYWYVTNKNELSSTLANSIFFTY